ncbi:hypothetical protein AX17_005380 [Amanita inopinata Kibby_2008]|nr:hypothetical protein AX17_005380 [Amanita inopinata Kibby_2008]
MFLLPTPSNSPAVWLVVGICYLTLVRCLRWRRYHAIHKKYEGRTQDITPEEAQEIMHESASWDMPLLMNYALAFALFKTYGIVRAVLVYMLICSPDSIFFKPSISRLLASTKQLKGLDTVSKRYADTEILISTWVDCPLNGIARNGTADPRGMLALARTNWLHSKYNIANEDLLYTLCLFVVEPPSWAEKYGWRPLSALEQQAFYAFWVEIGKRMNIKDIPDSLQGMKEWLKAYEMEQMVPAKTNQEVSFATVEELLYPVPRFFGLKRFGRGLIAATVEDIARVSMMMPEQPWYMYTAVQFIMSSMAFVQKNLMLPRLKAKSPVEFDLPKVLDSNQPVRMHPNKYAVRPWYKPKSRGFGYLGDMLAVLLGIYADMPGPHLEDDGYVLQTLGPLQFEKDGHDEVVRMAEALQGCPVPEPWRKAI